MESGFYVAYSGLAARMQALDFAASNLANASTAGFKAQSPFYLLLAAADGRHALSPLNRAVNQFGLLGGSHLDDRSGSLETTGNGTDLAIEGPGFFAVQTSAGTRYTRNGSFRLNTARQLTTQDGNPVLARQGTRTIPIVLPAGTVEVSPDGTIAVDGAVVAKLHVVEFKEGTSLLAEGDSRYVAPAGSEIPMAEPNVRQGMLESSNVNPIESAVGLISLQRESEMLGRALNLFSSVFDRAAAQDVPRVQ
jgi:flagellar basal-body rod protein FlgF